MATPPPRRRDPTHKLVIRNIGSDAVGQDRKRPHFMTPIALIAVGGQDHRLGL